MSFTRVTRGCRCLYSPNCREQSFSETHILDCESLSNRTDGKPIFSLGPGPIGHASCYAFGWIYRGRRGGGAVLTHNGCLRLRDPGGVSTLYRCAYTLIQMVHVAWGELA
jgi:hypothetical protein